MGRILRALFTDRNGNIRTGNIEIPNSPEQGPMPYFERLRPGVDHGPQASDVQQNTKPQDQLKRNLDTPTPVEDAFDSSF